MPGHDYSDSDPVVAQYERWTFPQPVDDLNDPALATYLSTFQTLKFLTPAYWPRGAPREDLDVLVAGCGTMAGACTAYLYPQHRVVGIDISRSSLAHEEKLKQRYNLSNLSLERLPVEEVGKLGRAFDYISCHGVLHHTPAPAVGLRALGAALNPQGVIGIMLYGKYGRVPVHMMQELFALLGLKQTVEDVGLARQTLLSLPTEHPIGPLLRSGAFAIHSDAAVVDMFLHPRDISYSVTDCLSLLNDSGLAFGGWDQNQMYYPDAWLIEGSPLRQRLDQLPQEKLWQAMELLIGRITAHWFWASRADRDPANYRIPWDSDELLNWIPLRAAQLIQRAGPDGTMQYAMGREGAPEVPISEVQASIFSQMDGRKTVAQSLAAAGKPVSDGPLPEDAASLLERLYRSGYGLVCAMR